MSAIVHGNDRNALLDLEGAVIYDQVCTCKVQHPEAGMGVFTASNIGKGQLVGN